MREELGSIKRELESLSVENKVIVWTMISMFLPFFITVPMVLFAFVYMIKEGRLHTVLKKVPFGYILVVFMVLTISVSFVYQNWWGVGLGSLLSILFFVMMYYRTLVHQHIFDLIIRVGIFIMTLCAIYALFEYAYRIIVMLNWDIMSIPIPSKRQYRIRVGFFNANYYAMMIEFTIILCFYKMRLVKNKSSKLYYFSILLFQVIILYLTGSRTGMVAALGGIGIMIIFLMNKYVISAFLLGSGGVIATLLMKPSLFPRVTFLARNFKARIAIWQGAWKCFKEAPLFGQGSFTYYFNYFQSIGTNHEMYKTQHAHNLLLDPLASYGIVGVCLLLVYFLGHIIEIWKLFRSKQDRELVALVIGVIMITVLHGVFDYTLFWIQTAMLFFFVLGATSMYFPKSQIRIRDEF